MSDLERFRQKVYCRKCKTKTNQAVIYKHTVGEDEFEQHGYYWSEDYIISQCMGCDTVGFIKVFDDVTMHFFNYETNESIDLDDITVYPPEPLNSKDNNNYNMVEFQHLPELLSTLYRQVVANVELGHYLLAAAGLRMIIEGICNDLKITKGYVIDDETGEIKTDKQGNQIQSSSLNGRINGLVEKGILTENQTTILHIIRKLGNQTVHKLNNPKKKILLDGLEIVEHTFKNIYELKKYDKLAKTI